MNELRTARATLQEQLEERTRTLATVNNELKVRPASTWQLGGHGGGEGTMFSASVQLLAGACQHGMGGCCRFSQSVTSQVSRPIREASRGGHWTIPVGSWNTESKPLFSPLLFRVVGEGGKAIAVTTSLHLHPAWYTPITPPPSLLPCPWSRRRPVSVAAAPDGRGCPARRGDAAPQEAHVRVRTGSGVGGEGRRVSKCAWCWPSGGGRRRRTRAASARYQRSARGGPDRRLANGGHSAPPFRFQPPLPSAASIGRRDCFPSGLSKPFPSPSNLHCAPRAGVYGLPEAIDEVKQLRVAIATRDSQIFRLVHDLNARSEALQNALEENDALRSELGRPLRPDEIKLRSRLELVEKQGRECTRDVRRQEMREEIVGTRREMSSPCVMAIRAPVPPAARCSSVWERRGGRRDRPRAQRKWRGRVTRLPPSQALVFRYLLSAPPAGDYAHRSNCGPSCTNMRTTSRVLRASASICSASCACTPLSCPLAQRRGWTGGVKRRENGGRGGDREEEARKTGMDRGTEMPGGGGNRGVIQESHAPEVQRVPQRIRRSTCQALLPRFPPLPPPFFICTRAAAKRLSSWTFPRRCCAALRTTSLPSALAAPTRASSRPAARRAPAPCLVQRAFLRCAQGGSAQSRLPGRRVEEGGMSSGLSDGRRATWRLFTIFPHCFFTLQSASMSWRGNCEPRARRETASRLSSTRSGRSAARRS